MSAVIFQYPKTAALGRVLPKSKVYEHGSPGSAVRRLFVRQVEQIVWQYKLAPETINLRATKGAPEIQIFSVALKSIELKIDVLRCIDQAIPFPIIFELCIDGRIKPVAAFKRPSEADTGKWVISEYFDAGWISEDTARNPLPISFDLETLYSQLLEPLMPYPAQPGEGLQSRVERMERIRQKERELERCEVRLRREKQFNHKVAINAELRNLKRELEILTD